MKILSFLLFEIKMMEIFTRSTGRLAIFFCYLKINVRGSALSVDIFFFSSPTANKLINKYQMREWTTWSKNLSCKICDEYVWIPYRNWPWKNSSIDIFKFHSPTFFIISGNFFWYYFFLSYIYSSNICCSIDAIMLPLNIHDVSFVAEFANK